MAYNTTEVRRLYFPTQRGRSGFNCSANQTLNGSTLVGWSEIRSGDVNRNRRRQIARGECASTDYSREYKTWQMPGAHAWTDWTEQNSGCSPHLRGHEWTMGNLGSLTLPGTSPSDIALTLADTIARENAYRAIRARQTAFQGGVFMGEIGETLRMLRGAGRNLWRGIHDYSWDVKRYLRLADNARRSAGNPRNYVPYLRDRTQHLSNMWLEHAYGWRPFWSDIGSANAALERRLDDYDPSYPWLGTGEDRRAVSTLPESGSDWSGNVAWRKVRNVETTARVSYYGRIRGKSAMDRLIFETRLMGFDPNSFIPTVYELIPYSFLVDYFTNLGNVIESWSTWESDLLWCSRGTYVERKQHVTDWAYDGAAVKAALPTPAFSPVGSLSSNGKHVSSWVIKSRSKNGGLAPPGFRFRIPGLGMKWLNIGALAIARSF